MSNDKTENQSTSKLLKPGTRTEKQLIVIIAPWNAPAITLKHKGEKMDY